MGNPVVHFEVMSGDPLDAQTFYRELFGWHIDNQVDMGNYGVVDTHAGEGINGGVGGSQDGSTYVTVYIEVPDLEASLKTVESLGGKRLMEPMEIPNVVAFAMFADPDGNAIGLVRGGGEDPGVSAGDGVAVGWFEVLGKDGNALRDFYGNAFGWTFRVAEEMDYGEVDTGTPGRGIPGGVGAAHDTPTVRIYAAVDDLTKYLERADALGAQIVQEPTDVGAGTTIAAFKDPQGNVFGMYKHVHPH